MFFKELLVVLLVLAATCCGQDSNDMVDDTRMYAGDDVQIEDYNYFAYLSDLKGYSSGPAFIIHPQWLLSTVRCINAEGWRKRQRHYQWVLAGNTNLTECAKNVQLRDIANFHLPPGKTYRDLESFALIHLSEPLDFGPKVGKARIPTERGMFLPKPGDHCIGLGRSNPVSIVDRPQGSYYLRMKKMDLVIAPNNECTLAKKNNRDFICTTHKKPGNHPCPVSRMAMVCNDTIVALSGYGMVPEVGCAYTNSELSWLRVDSVLPWIQHSIDTITSVLPIN